MAQKAFEIMRGQPIPAWDACHRLSIGGDIAPERGDSGTVFRLNSTFMDISDAQSRSERWLRGGLLAALLISALLALSFWWCANQVDRSAGELALWLAAATGFLGVAWYLAGDKWCYLKTRPIRFNRIQQTLHAIQRRRFFGRARLGDKTCELPWSDKVVFCVHKRDDLNGVNEAKARYHIRCYQVDRAGLVQQGISIGREWTGFDGLGDLLAQWNYWCWYMNNGPQDLPLPMMFISEREPAIESFHFSVSEFGGRLVPLVRIALLPYFLCLTILRMLMLILCCRPAWPPAVRKISAVDPDDPDALPAPGMPIGFPQMLVATLASEYPLPQSMATPGWVGDEDRVAHARLWQETGTDSW